MSSPAAAPASPLAALVLAWDETTPAVRALIAATRAPAPVLDSVLVMVPRAEAPDVLSAEEYLPLSPLTLEAEPPTDETAPPKPPAPLTLPVASALAPPAALPPPPAPEPQLWAAVRVLRLSSQPLPELARRAGQPLPAPAWTAAPATPAAPYQGATPPLVVTDPARPAAPAAGRATPAAAPLPPTYEPTKPPAAGANWPPALIGAALLRFEPGPAEPPAALPALPPPAEPDGWPAALAALRQPVPLPEAEATAPTPADPPNADKLLSNHLYDVPNLNFQVIQYARFAVPVALAEAPYAVIYAPAWPTWLAAQELRQRTGQPLVLHVAALAAPADEPLDLAAGWMAELQRQALRRADVVLTETAALAQRLCRELGLPGTCVHTVPAADAQGVAQALRAARPRPAAGPA